jgi:hypothetical protein
MVAAYGHQTPRRRRQWVGKSAAGAQLTAGVIEQGSAPLWHHSDVLARHEVGGGAGGTAEAGMAWLVGGGGGACKTTGRASQKAVGNGLSAPAPLAQTEARHGIGDAQRRASR